MIRWASTRPAVIWAFGVSLMLAGGVAFPKLPLATKTSVELPRLSVTASWPSASDGLAAAGAVRRAHAAALAASRSPMSWGSSGAGVPSTRLQSSDRLITPPRWSASVLAPGDGVQRRGYPDGIGKSEKAGGRRASQGRRGRPRAWP